MPVRVSRSTFVRHEPCPECIKHGNDTSGDNLGRYSDGSAYCFSCCYQENPKSLSLDRLVTKLGQKYENGEIKPSQEIESTKKAPISLPDDFNVNMPDEALHWLKKWGLTEAEIDKHDIGWSQKYERIVFPVRDKFHNLLMWQGRSLRTDQSKYFTSGLAEKTYHVLGDPNDCRVCVVEDIVSAIKVSRVLPCMPLWGSVLSTKRLVNLSEFYSSLFIWLDHDKQHYAVKRGIYARPFFNDNVRVIATILDPKQYTTELIQYYVKSNADPL